MSTVTGPNNSGYAASADGPPNSSAYDSGSYTDPGGTLYPGGWIGGGGGGGGGGSSKPSKGEKEAALNLGAIGGYNAQTIIDKVKNGDKALDIADDSNKNLKLFQAMNAEHTATGDWYKQQQKLQNVLAQQKDVMGNSAHGSFLLDLAEDIARADDMSDVEVLNKLRENLDTIDSDYYQAIMANNNSRNELYLDAEADLRNLFSDYVAQLNNINPDLVNGEEDEFPELVDTKNHTLKGVDWLDTDYFEEHMRDAIKPEMRKFSRPDQAALTALKSKLASRNTNFSGASNQNYFQRLLGGYNRRTQ